jgi:hypothetical protein
MRWVAYLADLDIISWLKFVEFDFNNFNIYLNSGRSFIVCLVYIFYLVFVLVSGDRD